MAFPVIEDDFEDVLSKAMRGFDLSVGELAASAGVPAEACEALLDGNFDVSDARAVAGALRLNPRRLVELAESPASPEVGLPEGIQFHNSPFPVPGYDAMTVNSYALLPPEQDTSGILIDAGSGFESVLTEDRGGKVRDWSLLLTHTHADHVAHFTALARIVARSFSPAAEPYADALPIREGEKLDCGPWRIKAIATAGHSPGGTSYLVEGAPVPVVFVGDALFCYSIGKVRQGYERALAAIREKILGLPDETILCPGHGPPTTVEFERKHNPFFA